MFYSRGGSLPFDPGKDYDMYDATIEQLYGILTNIHKSMRFQIVCDDEDVNFVVQRKTIIG